MSRRTPQVGGRVYTAHLNRAVAAALDAEKRVDWWLHASPFERSTHPRALADARAQLATALDELRRVQDIADRER